MKFEVKYRDKGGRIVTTVLDVADRNGVYGELRRQGVVPISMREVGDGRRRPGAGAGLASRIALLLALAAGAAAAWYFFFANDGQKRRIADAVTGAASRFMPDPAARAQAGADGDAGRGDARGRKRRGTGAVKVDFSE